VVAASQEPRPGDTFLSSFSGTDLKEGGVNTICGAELQPNNNAMFIFHELLKEHSPKNLKKKNWKEDVVNLL
jgi:hypothetical protein